MGKQDKRKKRLSPDLNANQLAILAVDIMDKGKSQDKQRLFEFCLRTTSDLNSGAKTNTRSQEL